MNNDLKKKQILFYMIAALLAGTFGYGFYAAIAGVSLAKEEYLEKYKEIAVLEEKQKQAKNIEEELKQNAAEILEIKKTLIEETYENKLAFVIDIENTAKSFSLIYDITITKELTKESLAKEKAELSRSRRKSQQIREEAAREQFPSIIFSIKLEGRYPAIVNFIEKLQTLPYYTNIDTFNITSRKLQGEANGAVEATVQVSVFTQ